MDPYKTHDIYFDFKNSQFKKNLIAHHHTIKDKRIILFMKHLYLRKIINLYPGYKIKKFLLKIVNKTFIGSN